MDSVKDGGLGIRSVTVLAPSAFLTSSAGTLYVQHSILPGRLHNQVDSSKVRSAIAWKKLAVNKVPAEAKQEKQKEWDSIITIIKNDITRTDQQYNRTFGSSSFEGIGHSSCSKDLLLAPPSTSVRPRMSNETIRISTGL